MKVIDSAVLSMTLFARIKFFVIKKLKKLNLNNFYSIKKGTLALSVAGGQKINVKICHKKTKN